MKDYYQILGVDKTASADEIKKSYRKLASKHHPDRGGDASMFKQVQEAYDTLGDPQKRAQYDNPQPQFDFSQQGANFDFDTIFQMFGQRMDPRQQMRNSRISIWLHLEDAVRGGNRLITINNNIGSSQLEIYIPPGIHDGENVRYPKLAPGGMDLVVNYRVHGHPIWQRDGLDLLCERELNFWQLILGTELTVQTILGKEVKLKIPPRTKPGSMLRMKSQGIHRQGHNPGDIFIKVKAVMPENIPNEILEVLTKYTTNK